MKAFKIILSTFIIILSVSAIVISGIAISTNGKNTIMGARELGLGEIFMEGEVTEMFFSNSTVEDKFNDQAFLTKVRDMVYSATFQKANKQKDVGISVTFVTANASYRIGVKDKLIGISINNEDMTYYRSNITTALDKILAGKLDELGKAS